MLELAPRPIPGAEAPSAAMRQRPPRSLWLLAGLVAVPAVIPVAYLLWVVLRPGGFDAGGFTGARLLELAGSTALLTVAVTVTTVAMGLTTAWLTTRTDLPRSAMWSTLVVVPLVIPSYVGALSILAASGNEGMLTQLARVVGLPGLPVLRGFWPTWAALSLWNFSFVHLLTVPVLRRLDPGLEDVARGLGAGRWKTVRSIVFPQLRPALAASALLVALYVLSEFGAVSMLRYETFTRAIYTQFAGRLDTGPALFLAGVLSTAALILVLVQQWARGRASLYTNRPTRQPRTHRLGTGGRLGARVLLGGIVTLALVLPVATMVWWVARGISLGNSPLSVTGHTARSILLSAVAAGLIALAAIPIGILVVRYPGRLTRVLESIPWLTYSLPHLAIGLAFLVLSVRLARPIYQTVPLLLVVYLAMFLPVALASVQSGMRRIGPGLEDVSRSLGVGSLATIRRVTIPLLRRSVLAGAALVFLSVMKELPATLLLRPTGFDTLPIRIWSATEELFYTQASFAALALVLVSAVPLYLFVVRDIHE